MLILLVLISVRNNHFLTNTLYIVDDRAAIRGEREREREREKATVYYPFPKPTRLVHNPEITHPLLPSMTPSPPTCCCSMPGGMYLAGILAAALPLAIAAMAAIAGPPITPPMPPGSWIRLGFISTRFIKQSMRVVHRPKHCRERGSHARGVYITQYTSRMRTTRVKEQTQE